MIDYKKAIKILSEKSVYPYMSRKKKIYLRGYKKNLLTKDEKNEIIRSLYIKSEDDIIRIHKEIDESREKSGRKTMKDWPEEERPREMLIKKGAENLTNTQLIAILLRTGTPSKTAQGLASEITGRYKNLRDIEKAPLEELLMIEGLGIAKIAQIKAAFELGRRFVLEEVKKGIKIKRPEDVLRYVKDLLYPYLRDKDKEFFYVIMLDIKNKIIDKIEVSKGSIDGTIVDPKEILKIASLKSASSVILLHNHPSGDAIPSEDDLRITSRIKEVLEIAGIRILDHIIIGKNQDDFYSFSSNKILG